MSKKEELEERRRKLYRETIDLALETLSMLPDEERKKVFDKFCRSCCTPIEGKDWSGQNYCCMCSPDPKDW